WSAAGRGRAAPGLSPLYTADGRLCAPVCVARAAEAANPARPPDDPLAHRLPAAGALCHRRPALGRSNDAGISQSPGRSRPYRPHPGTVDLSPRLPPTRDGAVAPHAGDAVTLAAAPGRRADQAGGTRQGAARRGRRADRGPAPRAPPVFGGSG